MKKNVLLAFSILLIFSMFMSMLYVAISGKNKSGVVEEIIENTNVSKNEEQILQTNIVSEPQTLHPGLATDSTSGSVLLQTFEGLSRIDLWNQRVNGVAKAIQISEDQKTYTFTLRDAKWTNGDPVIAKDFEYAWKYVLNPVNQSGNAYQLYYIEGAREYNEGTGNANEVGVKALDDKTLEVKLNKPTPNFLDLTASYTYFPINSKIAREYPDWANEASEHYTSNGPFEMTEWNHGENIVLKKNNNYWDANIVKLKSIIMLMINNPNKNLSMLEKGEIDWTGVTSGQLLLDHEEILGDGLFYSQTGAGTYSYKFNTMVEPFNNKNIRKAFALAINRQEIVNKNIEKGQLPAMAVVPPTLDQENQKGYFEDHDLKVAKQFLQKGLEDLGYKEASELPPITLTITTTERDKNIAQAIQQMWKEYLGIDIKLEDSEWTILEEKVKDNNFQVAQMGWAGELNDPINLLEIYSDAGWESKEFRSVIKQSKTETDIEKRKKLLRKAEAVLIEEMPVIPIYFHTIYYIIDGELKDVARSRLGQVQFKWAYFQY